MASNLKLFHQDHEQSNMVLKVLANPVRKEKEIKSIWIEKEEIKWSFFTDDIIIFVENPKELTRKASWN